MSLTDTQEPAAQGQISTLPSKKLDTSQIAMRQMGGGAMFMPRSMQEVVDFSTMMCKAGPALPPAWRGNPGLCMATTMQSLRWEMDPFAVAAKSYVTKDKGGNERIAYEAQLIAAVVNTRAPIVGRLRVDYEGEGASRRCVVSAMFKGDNKPTILKTPPLNQIGVKNSPLWSSDPDQQLAYYGQRAFGRRHCPEVLMGVYTPDEIAGMEGYDAQDITPTPPRPDPLKLAQQQLGARQDPPHNPQTGEIVEPGTEEPDDETEGDELGEFSESDELDRYIEKMRGELALAKTPIEANAVDVTFRDTLDGYVERKEVSEQRGTEITQAWGEATRARAGELVPGKRK